MRTGDTNLHIDLSGGGGGGDSTASTTAGAVIIRELPPIAALFLIYFDIRAGYTIAWKKTLAGVSLDGVEFKSLPSGLHNLKEDLVYFVQAPYAGLSAFVNVPAAESERNALMLSVGVLVPLSYGRLGRSWKHAGNLKRLARKFASDTSNHAPLEEYYDTHQVYPTTSSPPQSPIDSPSSLRYGLASSRYQQQQPLFDALHHTRTRSVSDTTALVPPGHTLSSFHPALSLPEFVDTFGPLIFPLYRAALNRKRILLITSAPVEKACNFVYDLSILSNIPLSTAPLLPSEPFRLRPLFSVGVHDIPFLEEEAAKSKTTPLRDHGEQGSWVACTTDGILYLKSELYDIVVTMPPLHNNLAQKKIWPKVEASGGGEIKATQRDLRRWKTLKSNLRRYKDGQHHQGTAKPKPTAAAAAATEGAVQRGEEEGEEGEGSTLIADDSDNDSSDEDTETQSLHEEQVCEKLTWREIAYSSFMWWASAGEKRTTDDDEDEDDEDPDPDNDNNDENHNFPASMYGKDPTKNKTTTATTTTTATNSNNTNDNLNTPLLSIEDPTPLQQQQQQHRHQRRRSSAAEPPHTSTTMGSAEMDIVAYFHRLTSRILIVLAEIIESSGPEEDDDDNEDPESDDTEGEVEWREDGGGGGGGGGAPVLINREDLKRLGLDLYSDADVAFVVEICKGWFGKVAVVEREGFSMCGIKCC